MNRIDQLFRRKTASILSLYFTAGHPVLENTLSLIKALDHAGVDMAEVGIPFSDPMADGPIIQRSSQVALKNGMSLKLLFEQLKEVRQETSMPILLMGYLNPVLQFGMERFCEHCMKTGIDGVILPDLPLEVFLDEYSQLFKQSELHKVFMVSPQTNPERVRLIESVSGGFLYLVSSSSTTGLKGKFAEEQIEYFERIRRMKLGKPTMIGFGIADHQTFKTACQYSHGAIIGSAFVKMLEEEGFSGTHVREFVNRVRG
jgi:tryptophan synthase alpha chain